MFDKKDCGFLTEDELLKILKNKRGEPLDEEEVKAMYKGKPPIVDGNGLMGNSVIIEDALGKVDYKAFAHLITTGAQEELAQA